jgi:crossover junction endodeoxyribonuclease RuvC
MRVLGIDPGLQRTGYGCIDCGRTGSVRVVEAGILRLQARASVAARLVALERDLTELIAELRPQRVAVEQVFVHAKHVRTAVIMAHARGVILLAAARADIPISEIAPTTVKSSLTGNGHATKRQIQLAIAARVGLTKPPSPADVADALAVALADANRKQ